MKQSQLLKLHARDAHQRRYLLTAVSVVVLLLGIVHPWTPAFAFNGLKGIYPGMTISALHAQVRETFGVSKPPMCDPPRHRGVGIFTEVCAWVFEPNGSAPTYAGLPLGGIDYSTRGQQVVEVAVWIRPIPTDGRLKVALHALLGSPDYDGRWDMTWIAVGPNRDWNVDYSLDSGRVSVIDAATNRVLQDALRNARERTERQKRKDM